MDVRLRELDGAGGANARVRARDDDRLRHSVPPNYLTNCQITFPDDSSRNEPPRRVSFSSGGPSPKPEVPPQGIGCFWKNSHIASVARMSWDVWPMTANGIAPGQVWPPFCMVQRVTSALLAHASWVMHFTSPRFTVSRGLSVQPLRVAQPSVESG